MAQTVASPGSESALLRRRLAALRHRLLLVIVVRGLGWLLTALLAGALACGLLDWRWHLPSSVRAVFLVGTLAAAGCLAYRYLFLPLSARLDDLALALRIEEHYDQLNDALASTVEFLREPPDSEQFGSPSLRREAVRRALRRAQDCDFGRVIDRRGLHLAGALALLLGSGAVTLAVLHPTLARTALLRLVHPFGGFEWPKQTLLEIDPPRERIGRNEPFEVRGRIRGVIPEQVTVLFKLDDSQTIEHACAVQRAPAPFPHEGEGKGEGAGTFATVLKPGQARREIRFRVQANDAVSPGPDRWYRVVVLPPPSLAPLDGRASPQVRLRPPAYTDLPVQDLPDGIGDIETVAGTHVTLRAAADRPLARAWIEYEPEPPFVGLAAFLAPLASRHAAGTAALAAAGREVWGEVRAELSADRQTFAAAFVPRASGRYLLNFEDDSGLRNSRLFELRVLADPPPLVNLDRPSDKRDILSVLPTAELPLQALVEDPQFAVRSAWLEYRTRPGDQPPAASLDPVHRLPLYDHQVAGAEAWGPFARLVPPLRLREKRVEIDRRLSLAKLPGIRLREGDLLILQVCADDFDDVDFTKPPGRSHEVEVRIISRDTLDLILTQQQAEVQKELLRLREQEREAIKKVAEVQARLRKLGRLDDEDLGQLQQTEQLQEQIRERIGSRRQEGLRREVARILETLQNNQLPRSAVHERMEQVGGELERLAREELEPIESRLNRARRQTESPGERARERQRQAQTLEQLAEDKEREARQAERQTADRPDTDPVKNAAREGAKLLRQQAQELRQTAQALRQGREDQPEERARRAQLLEQLAQEKDRAAARAEQAAERRPENDPARVMAEEEARRLRQQAQELRQTAEELRQGEAARDDVRAMLAEARRHQEEVEKTLSDLLNRVLDPFASTMEIKGEARAILQEQRRLLQQTEELNKQLQGKAPEELPKPQQAQLEQVKDDQRRLESRTNQLLDRMEQVRQDRQSKGDQDTARELQQALDTARKGEIARHMRSARDQIQQNQLNQAVKSQQASARQLEELVKQLEDRREAELDRLAKRLRELERELEKLTAEQEQLQKKVKEAAAITDPQKRAEELKRLSREQERLHQRAQDMAERLSRMRQERAGQEMGRAVGQMEQALRQLERGQNPDEQQDEALERLNETQRELAQAREQVEEELAREQLAKIADILKNIKERHEAQLAEARRIQGEVEPQGWTGGRAGSWGRLGQAQKGLAKETATLAEEKLTGAPVFARILDRVAQAMEQAGQGIIDHRDRLRQRLNDAPVEELTRGLKFQPEDKAAFERTTRLQQEALRRLEQLLEALKEQQAVAGMGRRPEGEPGGEGGEGGESGGRPPGDGIPPVAQLKLLRALQAEVNQRTAEFHDKHPDPSKLTKEELTELQAIRRDQQDIADLLDEMTRPADRRGDRP